MIVMYSYKRLRRDEKNDIVHKEDRERSKNI